MVRDYRLAQKRGAVAAAASLALLFPIAFVQAQSGSVNSLETSMPELLSGKTIPLKLQMKDLLGVKWRRVTTIGKPVAAMANASSVLSSAPTYTKGQTVRMDGESFLVLYTLQSLGTKDAITARVVFGGKSTPDAPLALTLLGLRNVSALESVAEFRLSEETVT